MSNPFTVPGYEEDPNQSDSMKNALRDSSKAEYYEIAPGVYVSLSLWFQTIFGCGFTTTPYCGDLQPEAIAEAATEYAGNAAIPMVFHGLYLGIYHKYDHGFGENYYLIGYETLNIALDELEDAWEMILPCLTSGTFG